MHNNEPKNDELAQLSRSPELMNAAETLLCVIDLQQRLLPVIDGHERIVWNARRLLNAARLLQLRAIATEQYPEKLGSTVESLATLLPEPAVSKLAFSAAGCTGLFAQQLSEISTGGRHRALLCGIETHVCIQQTAYDLLSAGYQVFLAVDATGTRHKHDHEIALRRMESAGVVLTTTEAALFEWCREAGTPEFKQISQLVKEPHP